MSLQIPSPCVLVVGLVGCSCLVVFFKFQLVKFSPRNLRGLRDSSTTSSSRTDQKCPVVFNISLACNKEVNSVKFLLGVSWGFQRDCH